MVDGATCFVDPPKQKADKPVSEQELRHRVLGGYSVENTAPQHSVPSTLAFKLSAVWEACCDTVLRIAIQSLSLGPLPRHMAFIMDGNRRWSRANGLRVQEGHHIGFETLKRVLDLCLSLKRVEIVTVYAFAIDNFKRDASEVDALMELARTRLLELYHEGEFVARYSLRIRIVGQRDLLPAAVQETAKRVEDATRDNTGPTLNICMPYAAQHEISCAASDAAQESRPITQETLASHLMVPTDVPIDILVRTSHVSRLSDFLLWQCNEQTQLHFVDEYWPMFGAKEMLYILLSYQQACTKRTGC